MKEIIENYVGAIVDGTIGILLLTFFVFVMDFLTMYY